MTATHTMRCRFTRAEIRSTVRADINENQTPATCSTLTLAGHIIDDDGDTSWADMPVSLTLDTQVRLTPLVLADGTVCLGHVERLAAEEQAALPEIAEFILHGNADWLGDWRSLATTLLANPALALELEVRYQCQPPAAVRLRAGRNALYRWLLRCEMVLTCS